MIFHDPMVNGINHIIITDVSLGTYMKFPTFSHFTLMTHIISYSVRFYKMTITLFIPTIYGILPIHTTNTTHKSWQ
jgi:hypothetical protein